MAVDEGSRWRDCMEYNNEVTKRLRICQFDARNVWYPRSSPTSPIVTERPTRLWYVIRDLQLENQKKDELLKLQDAKIQAMTSRIDDAAEVFLRLEEKVDRIKLTLTNIKHSL